MAGTVTSSTRPGIHPAYEVPHEDLVVLLMLQDVQQRDEITACKSGFVAGVSVDADDVTTEDRPQ